MCLFFNTIYQPSSVWTYGTRDGRCKCSDRGRRIPPTKRRQRSSWRRGKFSSAKEEHNFFHWFWSMIWRPSFPVNSSIPDFSSSQYSYLQCIVLSLHRRLFCQRLVSFLQLTSKFLAYSSPLSQSYMFDRIITPHSFMPPATATLPS